ncbi:winged helix-turn-helix domain-containing protein [Synechococcus sp. HK05]|uniref:winged helix-turn-helix domain-containing protein n=1 Tax=Synechococcus sp. HK05 TaxID=2725975 RepID=UPI0020CAB414|nr:winged helix-turn-helix domain-containing protein [Synechococcus sp. HK05]
MDEWFFRIIQLQSRHALAGFQLVDAMTPPQTTSIRVLLVDLEEPIHEELPTRLIKLGYSVLITNRLADALRLLRLTEPDLIILDGQQWLCHLMALRQHSNKPLILLKSNHDLAERVTALQLGSDDVLIKPFSVRELEARIRAVLRRIPSRAKGAAPPAEQPLPHSLILGELHLDLERRQAWRGQQRIRLTGLECKLLEALICRAGETLSRRELVQLVWGFDSEFVSVRRLVDSAVSRLRAKLEVDPDNPELILTIRGVGYMFRRLQRQPEGGPQAGDDDVIDLDAWRARQWGLPPP